MAAEGSVALGRVGSASVRRYKEMGASGANEGPTSQERGTDGARLNVGLVGGQMLRERNRPKWRRRREGGSEERRSAPGYG